jgi:branched-chain amino acid transport system permease protein
MKKLIPVYLVAAILIFTAPYLFEHHLVYIISLFLCYSIFALALNLVLGYMGKLSFGHGAFFGLGAFSLAYLLEFVPFPLALLGSIAVSSFFAGLVGLVCARLKSIYFAMFTLAAGEAIYFVVLQLVSIRGLYGLSVPTLEPMKIFGLKMNLGSFNNYYFFIVITLFVLTWTMYTITRSSFGNMIKAIRENVDRVEFIGVNERRLQWANFLISGVFAGIAGALYAPLVGYLAPEIIGFAGSAEGVIMVILGGPNTFVGPIVGAFLLVFIKEYLSILTEHWLFFLGIVLLIIVYVLPGGVAGYVSDKLKPR